MNIQRVRLELLSNCGRLLTGFGHSCKSYLLNDEAEQEWAKLACMEAVAELRTQQNRKARQRVVKRNR